MKVNLIPTTAENTLGSFTSYRVKTKAIMPLHNYLMIILDVERSATDFELLIDRKAQMALYEEKWWKIAPKSFVQIVSSPTC
jgi:hypothetical protein